MSTDDHVPPLQERPAVEVEIISPWIAVVTLRGEHDLNSKPAVMAGVQRAAEHPLVIADLSECSFIDSTVIAVLVGAYRSQLERAARLELVLPADPRGAVRRVIAIAGLDAVMTIHHDREAALASQAPRDV